MRIRKIAVSLVTVASVCAAAPAPAAAAPRIAIAGVRNDPDGAVAAALSRAVCGRLECVSRTLVHTGGKLDFAAARRNRVDAILFGTVSERSERRVLALALLRDSLKPVKTWSLPLDPRGQVQGGAGVAAEVAALVDGASPRAASRPAPAPAAVDRSGAGRAAAVDEPAPARGAAAAAPRAGTSRTIPSRPSADPPRGGALGAVDLGVGALQRKLTFSGVGASSTTLMEFSGGMAVVPAIRAEVFPLAGDDAWYAGLGVFGGYARSVGFRTEDASSGLLHDTIYSALDAGVSYRAPPLGPGIRLVPALWYRSVGFEVKAKNGAPVAGLPDASLSGVAVGLDVEAPIWRRVRLLAGGRYTYWSGAKDLVGSYFARGSASAFGGDAGVSLDLSGPFSFRVVGTLEVTRYSLSGTSTYVASGASERYVGVRSAVRYAF